MGKYMKMSDYFVGDMLPEDIVILDGGVATVIYTSEEAAAYAINSHDELVAEVERLRMMISECYPYIRGKADWGTDREVDLANRLFDAAK